MGGGVRFRRDSWEEMCNGVAGYRNRGGKFACSRIAGHKGKCIALMCDAALADGVCHGCRKPINEEHDPECYAYRMSAGQIYQGLLKLLQEHDEPDRIRELMDISWRRMSEDDRRHVVKLAKELQH